MKAEELRLGNFVFIYRDQILEITMTELNNIYAFPKHYKPIPLTIQWLLRFGFKEDITKHAKFYLIDLKKVAVNVLKGLCLYYEESDDEWNVCFIDYYSGTEKTEMFPNNINYVHQLQNLYFALTGQELTVKELI